ncbi:MAG: HAMP domain-containing sensor histidine kinase [Lachnospiraceae bacterium]|jgi:two-component system sensor histidine kinase VanS|nr:HAMP domain-containing sensor histidine kinase [Lachnospiraceae bacterium]
MNKLRTQAVIAFSAFLLLVVGGSSIFYFLFAEDYYISKKKKLMDTAFESIKQVDLTKMTSDGDEVLLALEDESFSVIICNDDFDLIYSSKIRNNDILIQEQIIHQKDVYSHDAKARYLENLEKKPVCLYGLIEQQDHLFYVYIYENTTVIRRSVDYANHFLMDVLVVALVFGGFFAYLVARKIVKPVENIRMVAKKIAENDFSVRADGNIKTRELAQLAQSLNQMADKIQRDINDLSNYNYLLLRQNQNMAEFEDMRKKFVSNVTHELKTPLAIISSQVEMLQFEYDDTKKDYYFSSIMEEIDKMSRLISDILHNAFTEVPLPNSMMARDNLSTLVCTLLPKYEVWLAASKIRCVSSIQEDCYAVFDALQIEQAVNNYVMNAYNHTPPGHQVVISLKQEKDTICLSVYNEGSPIPAEEQEKIWKSFYQVNRQEAQKSSNEIGLGLYIVKDIIRLHKGTCGVTNCKNGVEFWFRLPK